MTIDLPRSHYRILNPPAPPRWAIAVTMAGIALGALAWALLGV